jgi:hypothetical protein
MRTTGRGFLLALALAPAAAGCTTRPHAPPLVNEAVYQNDKVGVRFLAPDGWTITSRSDLPPGKLERPVVVVSYVQSQGYKPGEFELVAADLPETADLGDFLTNYRIGPEKWVMKPPPTATTVGGEPATQFVLTRKVGKSEYRREATAVRRGGRVYFFVISFLTTDAEHRDQARKSVESVTWTK